MTKKIRMTKPETAFLHGIRRMGIDIQTGSRAVAAPDAMADLSSGMVMSRRHPAKAGYSSGDLLICFDMTACSFLSKRFAFSLLYLPSVDFLCHCPSLVSLKNLEGLMGLDASLRSSARLE